MKFHLAVLLLAAIVHFAYSQYYAVGYPEAEEDDLAYDDTALAGGLQAIPAGAIQAMPASMPVGGLQPGYDSEYTLIPVQIVPVYNDEQPFYDRETRSKKGKKKKGKKKKKGWGWGWPKIKHIWLKAPKFYAHPPVIHIHPAPKHHVHKTVHHGWGWGHGGGGGGGGGGGFKK